MFTWSDTKRANNHGFGEATNSSWPHTRGVLYYRLVSSDVSLAILFFKLKIQNHDIRDVQKEEWCVEGEFELYKGLIHDYF